MDKKEEKTAENLLQDINTVISEMEEAELEKEASRVVKVLYKVAERIKFDENNKLQSLAELSDYLRLQGNIIEANRIQNLFVKQASEFKKKYEVPFPMNLDDALNNYDSGSYEVDKDGQWEDTETISEFREEASDDLMHSPAAVDHNHLIFYNEDEDHIEVMNMIPKHHLDTLHKQPSKKTRFIKRADD